MGQRGEKNRRICLKTPWYVDTPRHGPLTVSPTHRSILTLSSLKLPPLPEQKTVAALALFTASASAFMAPQKAFRPETALAAGRSTLSNPSAACPLGQLMAAALWDDKEGLRAALLVALDGRDLALLA